MTYNLLYVLQEFNVKFEISCFKKTYLCEDKNRCFIFNFVKMMVQVFAIIEFHLPTDPQRYSSKAAHPQLPALVQMMTCSLSWPTCNPYLWTSQYKAGNCKPV